ncbi:MAG: hypothetical protein V4736_06620 [Bdellovibrionota bacterium]
MLTFKRLKNQNGMAVLEMIPIIIVVVILLNFSIGFFGVMHTGILNSIAARNYLFENLRNRSDLTYHIRTSPKINYRNNKNRYSGIVSDKQQLTEIGFIATARPIAFVSGFGGTDQNGVDLSKVGASNGAEVTTHRTRIPASAFAQGDRKDAGLDVGSVWIKTMYGICLDSTCGD